MERLQGILRDLDLFISVSDGFKESARVLQADINRKAGEL
jgi:hypothetical protein